MTTKAFVGQSSLYRGDGASPQTFSQFCALIAISGLGETNQLVDATSFCSGESMEYIAGLSDGSEVTLDCNFETVGDSQQAIKDFIEDVKDKVTRSFEWRVRGDPSSPLTVKRTFHFDLVSLSWELAPSFTTKNTIKFTGKISGPIDITDT